MIFEYWWGGGGGLRGVARRWRGVVCLMRTDVSQMCVVRYNWNCSGNKPHTERLWRYCGAYRTLQRRRCIAGHHLHVELMHHTRKEHEHLHPRQHITQTHSPPNTKRHEELWPSDFAGIVYEPTRIELVRLVP